MKLPNQGLLLTAATQRRNLDSRRSRASSSTRAVAGESGGLKHGKKDGAKHEPLRASVCRLKPVPRP